MTDRTWSGIDPLILKRVEDRQNELNALRPWPARVAERLWEGLLPRWIAGSNALDGNKLSVEETSSILEGSGPVTMISLREHFEALNHRAALERLRRMAQAKRPPRAADVRRLHAILLTDIDDESRGVYRRYSLESDGDADSVGDLMRRWELWCQGPARTLHPIERAAVVHHRLLRIYPFLDVNGLTARLIMNLSLLCDDYLPAILDYEDRHDYRAALYAADCGSYVPAVELVARAIERVQTIYLLVLHPRSGA